MQLNDKKCIVCYCLFAYQKKKPCNQLKYRVLTVPGAGLEPAQPQWSQDFKSCVSTIPPSGQKMSLGLVVLQSCSLKHPIMKKWEVQIYNKKSLIKTVNEMIKD